MHKPELTTNEIMLEKTVTSNSLPSNSREEAAHSMQAGQWQASLNLSVENRFAGARLVDCQRQGPLHVQKTFYPEGPNLAHLYLLHPPGGLVSGDSLTIKAQVGEDSAALITTPGAGRLYGARKSLNNQFQNNLLNVKRGASLEWFPMETLFYSRSMGVSKTRVDVSAGGRFIGWDICSLGLPASGKPFIEGELRQTFDLYYDGDITWLERWRFNAKDTAFLNSNAGLKGYSANGVFIAGPFEHDIASDVMDELRTRCTTVRNAKQGLAGVSLVNNWLVIRYVGASTTHTREFFMSAWKLLRPLLLKRPACPPRIWAC